MRTKQSSTASGMQSRSETLTAALPIHATAMGFPGEGSLHPASPLRGAITMPLDRRSSGFARQETYGAGLLHDARNLMGAIDLYCDLLSLPDVLKPDHRHYAEELRLLGSRSGTLIQRLMESGMRPAPAGARASGADLALQAQPSRSLVPAGAGVAGARLAVPRPAAPAPAPVSLRAIVERCSGLLSRVANGRVIEVSYGPAASVPVSVDEEAVERILVNLARNSAAALDKPGRSGKTAGDSGTPAEKTPVGAARSTVIERIADGTADETPGAVRIGVGLLVNRADDPGRLPLRRLRLTVEDSGCGMTAQQLGRILSGNRAPSRSRHGIGLRVVRELVADSGGDLRVMSSPGIGTRVQIEWPVAEMPHEDAPKTTSAPHWEPASEGSSGAFELPRPVQTGLGLHAPQGPCATGRAASRGGPRPATPRTVPGTRGDIHSSNGKWAVC